MESPQTKTDELLTKVDSYNYKVDSLQVLVWTELRNIKSEQSFLETHRDNIRHKKLTKLEEVEYILQLIGDINKDQSIDFENRIKDLEETKGLLEKHSKKLREQLDYTSDLLEEVVRENSELVDQLKQKGLSEKEFKKQLKCKQLIETQDDTIQRLQIALEGARRELDIIHRARSPTPSLALELSKLDPKGIQIPLVVVDKAQEDIKSSNEEESTEETNAGETETGEEETVAIDLLCKARSIVKNAKKAGSRGYTSETQKRKLNDLAQYKLQFDQLDRTNIRDSRIIEEFESLLTVAESILKKRSTSPIHTLNLGSNSNHPINMPNLSEIVKIVNSTVPTFFGTDGTDLSSEVFRYIQGCKMVERELIAEADGRLEQEVIECLKLRLMGSAYSKISQLNFESVDALCNTVKKIYLKRKSLDQIRELIIGCKQSIREPASKFGDRIESLLNEAINTITTEWSERNSRETMITDFKRISVKSFIKGLRDQSLRARFIGQERQELSSLISIVEEAEELFGEPQHAMNTVSAIEPCSFCDKQGHERVNCQKRLNTPYCISCGKYGHEVGPLCRNNRTYQESCGYCKNRGHTVEVCRKKLSSLYCRMCRINGHMENRFCQQKKTRNTVEFNHWQGSTTNNGRRQVNTHFSRGNDTFQQNKSFGSSKCFKCNQPGHFSRDCQRGFSANGARAGEKYGNVNGSTSISNGTKNNSGNDIRPGYSQ